MLISVKSSVIGAFEMLPSWDRLLTLGEDRAGRAGGSGVEKGLRGSIKREHFLQVRGTGGDGGEKEESGSGSRSESGSESGSGSRSGSESGSRSGSGSEDGADLQEEAWVQPQPWQEQQRRSSSRTFGF